jgi:hypothetical protein
MPFRLPRPTLAYAAALAALFLGTAYLRFMMLGTGFTNDHFLHLANAQQMLLGEWPTRDFLDPGLPLMYATSALAQMVLGRTLLAEGVLVSLTFAGAAVLTAMAVRELTGSRVLALVAAVLEVAIVPRAYGYPKLLLYAAAFFLLQHYVTRPTTGRLLAFAAMVPIAFLFRHDHGVNLGAAGALTMWLANGPDGRPGGLRRSATFLAIVVAFTIPYIVYVQINGGLWSYVQVGLEFRRVEMTRQAFASPSFQERFYEAALFYGYWALPIAAVLTVFARVRRDDFRTIAARLAPIATVAVLVNWTFLRDPLTGRLQDAIVPAVTLGAWLTSCAWRSHYRWAWGPLTVLLLVTFAKAVVEVGGTLDQLARAGLLDSWNRWPAMGDVASRLSAPNSPRVLPSRPSAALLPFYPYVRRCTTPEQRLLVIGNATEVLFFAQRGFAGRQAAFVQGYYESEPYQRSVLSTLAAQMVPFVVIPGRSYTGDYGAVFPLLARYIRDRYVPLAQFGDPDTGAEVLIDRTVPARGRDPETGWPCPTQ